MTSKNKVLFNVTNTPSRIKLLAIHPRKDWLATVNTSNSFTLWNYK